MMNSAKASARGRDGSLDFAVLSMNKVKQTESATCSILLFCMFFKGSVFLYFNIKGKDGVALS
jgi:hypothetical protein